MHGERGQSSRVVVCVAVDVVVAVAIYDAAAGRVDSSIVPRDHRMRDPKDGIRVRAKSDRVVAGNEIAQHGGGPAERPDAANEVVGSLAIDDGDIKRPGRRRTNHEEPEAVIVRRDFAEHVGDGRRSDGRDSDPVARTIGRNGYRNRFDGEVPAGVEQDAVRSDAKSLDEQAAQVNAVVCAGIDRDAVHARYGLNAGDADAVVDDAVPLMVTAP
jgi:hypothetical protein